MFGILGLFSSKKKEEKLEVNNDLTKDSKLSLGDAYTTEIPKERKPLKALRNEVNEVLMKYKINQEIWVCEVCQAENLKSNIACCVCETSK